jgi:hypothetical protein
VTDEWVWIHAGVAVPGSSRVLRTSRGLVHITFGGTALLNEVGEDGWCPVFRGARRVERSTRAFAAALRNLDLPEDEATRLAEEALLAWERVPLPPPRTLQQRARSTARTAGLVLRLLLAAPRLFKKMRRDVRESRDVCGEVPVPPSEFGMMRLIDTSVGLAEFEFWGGPKGRLGIYGDDGWLPMTASRRPQFDATAQGAVAALTAQGVSQDEAEELGSLVMQERHLRVGAAAT